MSKLDEIHAGTDTVSAAPQQRFEPARVPGPDRAGRPLRKIGDVLAKSRVTRFLWRDRRLAAAGTAGSVAVVGLCVGWWTPRGPMTTSQALASIAISGAVGLAAGFVQRSRWAMLVAPLGFALAFEAARLGSDGPTVDAIRLRSTYGVLGATVGRGFHGIVAVVPMVLGAVFGAALARWVHDRTSARPGRARVGLYARRGVAAFATIGVLGLAAGIARPARTGAIRDANGDKVSGSIAELIRVKIGGHDLAMMIRGSSTANPILLYLAGGPGGSEMGAMRNHLSALEKNFLVVTWDQRGTGKSYTEIEPTSTLTFDNAIADTIEVTNYLRGRFGQDKIYLVGQSYGSTLGVRAVQRHPELYRALVGSGQMVSQRETDRIFYRDTLAWALSRGDGNLVAKLTKLGPPPYKHLLDLESTLGYEHEVYPYDHSRNHEGEGGFSENFFVGEYSLVEQVHLLGGFLDTFNFMYPQLQEIDFRVDATRLDVPVYLAQGAHEARGRAELANEWFETLDAPHKEMKVFDTSGHRPLFEQPDLFVEFMSKVLADTGPTR
jgi:proline iminopeptidase